MKPIVFFPISDDACRWYWSTDALDRLRDLATVVEPSDGEAPWESCGTDAQAVVVGWGAPRLPAAVWRCTPSLKLISIYGGSASYVEEPVEALRTGITLANASPEMGEAVAESALALMLSARYGIAESCQSYRQTGALSYEPGQLNRSLAGSTVGLIGFGHIGRMVAELLRPLSVDLLVHDPYVSPNAIVRSGGRATDLEDLLKRSDVISLHAGWTKETEGMLGPGQLDLTKPGTLIVSTARMPIFDQRALAERVLSGRLRFASDFIPFDPSIWSSEEMRACPHLVAVHNHTSVTDRSVDRMADRVVRNIEQYFAGELPDNAIDEAWIERTT